MNSTWQQCSTAGSQAQCLACVESCCRSVAKSLALNRHWSIGCTRPSLCELCLLCLMMQQLCMVLRKGAARDCDRCLPVAALGKYSSSMQQASLGGSHFAERAANILDDEPAFKMLSRSVLCLMTFFRALRGVPPLLLLQCSSAG